MDSSPQGKITSWWKNMRPSDSLVFALGDAAGEIAVLVSHLNMFCRPSRKFIHQYRERESGAGALLCKNVTN